jgi:hypothetical protein
MKRILREFKARHPQPAQYEAHYQSMKSLLGEETHEKHRQRIKSLSQLQSQSIRMDGWTYNDNFTMPEPDVRALQYDPCSEYFSYGQSSFIFFTLYFPFLFHFCFYYS